MSIAGGAVVSIWHDIVPEGLDDFYAWHSHEHMPERVGIPGFLRGRRYIAEEGEPEFFTLYEAESVGVLGGADYLERLNNPTPWTLRAVDHFANVSRAIQQVRFTAGPGMGGHLMTRQFEGPSDGRDAMMEALRANLLEPLVSIHGITGVHLCETDGTISGLETRERQARDGDTGVPGWALMIESDRPKTLRSAIAERSIEQALQKAGAQQLGDSALYRLEYIRTRSDTTP